MSSTSCSLVFVLWSIVFANSGNDAIAASGLSGRQNQSAGENNISCIEGMSTGDAFVVMFLFNASVVIRVTRGRCGRRGYT